VKGSVELFEEVEGIVLEVKLDGETVWLSQQQLAELFERNQSVISRHINRIFKDGELTAESNMQKVHIAHSDKPISFYNLDVIISVGYRVNSARGIQFRQWATKRLKQYLLQGIAINERRIQHQNQEIQILHDGIRILSRAIEIQNQEIQDPNWLTSFSQGLRLLDDYDHERLDNAGRHTQDVRYPRADEYWAMIEAMREEFATDVFGKEKDGGFESALGQIQQSFNDDDLYPSIEEKAAMLLYLVVKNHAFVDGNKRIAAACFLLFLRKNNLLQTKQGLPIISQDALASLTLFVAASKPEEMQTVKRLLISVLNRNT
jgi:hypothetical protein